MALPTTQPKPSILPFEMQGVCSITGRRGIGKSYLASQADLPQNIAYFDFENKGRGIDSQMHFGLYRALTQEVSGDPIALYNTTMQAVASLPNDMFTVLVLDNISPLELALRAEAKRGADNYGERYGLQPSNIRAGRFGGSSSVANFMIGDLCAHLHSKGIRLIVPIAHISARWSAGGQIPNKYNIKGADRWQELSILTLILIQGSQPPIPDALVQKEQLGSISINANPTPDQLTAMMRGEAGHTVSRRLPFKIPQCTFQKIRWYLSNPIDLNNLKENEKPTLAESDPFTEELNKEQFTYARDMAAAAARDEEKAAQEEQQAQVMANLATQNAAMALEGDVRAILQSNPTADAPFVWNQLKATKPDVMMGQVAAALIKIRVS